MTEERQGSAETSRAPKKVPVAEAISPTPEPVSSPNGLSAKAYYAILLLLTALSLWIRQAFPIHAIGNAVHDDALFVRLARHLAAGEWLGQYDNLTLAKGMFYPLFIAISQFLSIPLKMAEQAIYLAASASAAGLARKHAGNNYLGVALFAALSFNPVLWHVDLARVIREGLYVGLSLMVIALAVMIVFPGPIVSRSSFLGRAIKGFGLGFVGAAFYLTREEGIWLAPALIVVIAVALIGILLPRRTSSPSLPNRFAQLKAIALPSALALVVFLATNGFVATLNYQHYGVFATNEFKTKSFLRAYGSITRIRPNEWQHYVLFPKDARQRAYAVSPAAQELAGSLEGPLAEAWRINSCSTAKDTVCSEVLAGWLMWEFRDAVRDAGHYATAAQAMSFYNTLADQIDSACDDGRLECLPRRATMATPFRWELAGETAMSAKVIARKVLMLGDGQIGSAPSIGSPQEIAVFADTVGGVYPPDDLFRSVRGWIASGGGPPSIRLFTIKAECQSSIRTLPAPDIIPRCPDLKAQRFDVETPGCPVSAGGLLVEGSGFALPAIPLAMLAPGIHLDTPTLQLMVENVSTSSSIRLPDSIQLKIASAIASGYAVTFPILTVLGAAGMLLAIILGKPHPFPTALVAFALASAAAVCTRIVLLAYIDASSFPAATVLYCSPASPFVVILAVVGIYLGCATVVSLNRSGRMP